MNKKQSEIIAFGALTAAITMQYDGQYPKGHIENTSLLGLFLAGRYLDDDIAALKRKIKNKIAYFERTHLKQQNGKHATLSMLLAIAEKLQPKPQSEEQSAINDLIDTLNRWFWCVDRRGNRNVDVDCGARLAGKWALA